MRKFAWRFTRLQVLGAALCAGFCSSAALAVQIYAVDGAGLIRFDSASPQSVTRIGEAFGLMQGLDFAPNGTLYGFSNDGLYSYNTTTGDRTFIGNPDLQEERVLDMSWNPADDRMEILTALTSDEPHHLRSVDLSNGNVTTIGTVSIPLPASAFGFAIDNAGTRYLHDGDSAQMIRLNAGLNGTNMVSPVGNALGVLEGMTIHWSGDGAWYHAGLSGDSGRQELWSINQATGAGAFLGNVGDIEQFNFGDIAIFPVPEPSTLALLALGGLALRRR